MPSSLCPPGLGRQRGSDLRPAWPDARWVAKGYPFLCSAGVDGFSLYELQVSAGNRRFVQRYDLDQRDRRRNYLFGQVASHLLGALGYRKTLLIILRGPGIRIFTSHFRNVERTVWPWVPSQMACLETTTTVTWSMLPICGASDTSTRGLRVGCAVALLRTVAALAVALMAGRVRIFTPG